MRNSSHSPGCMRAFPASQSCQVRRVEWIRPAAAVCDRPAASRAARTSSGAGLEEGPFGPRFGWLATAGGLEGADGVLVALVPEDLAAVIGGAHFVEAAVPVVLGQHRFDGSGVLNDAARAVEGDFGGIGVCHFHLQPLSPEARRMRCIHELHSTRIPCNCKNYLRKIFEAVSPPHNA